MIFVLRENLKSLGNTLILKDFDIIQMIVRLDRNITLSLVHASHCFDIEKIGVPSSLFIFIAD